MPLRPSMDPRRWGALLREVLPYAAATAVGFIYVNLTIVVLDFVAGDVEVGLFGAAFRVFIVLAGASALIAQTVFPLLTRAARDDRARLGYQVQRLLEGCLIIGAVAGLGTFFAAPVAIDVLTGGGEFEGSVDVLELQGIAFAATFPAGVAGFALLAMRRYRELLGVNAAALIVSLAVTLALADAVGAATANIAGEATLLAGCVWALMRGADGLRLRPGLAPRALLATAAGAAAGALSPGPAVLETAVALAAFGVALLALRGVPAEIRQAFVQRD
jgi:O-antigen/teichoic acid export membrane protein